MKIELKHSNQRKSNQILQKLGDNIKILEKNAQLNDMDNLN